MWDHERLQVYGKALDAVVMLHQAAGAFPVGVGDLRDQLRRSANSIILNIAEGATEFSPGEKAKFYRVAKRSCAECIAVLDLAGRLAKPHPVEGRARVLLDEVAAMLTTMAKNVAREPPA